jgi:Holliday junction resolvasome RuvABC endonuclease subunit
LKVTLKTVKDALGSDVKKNYTVLGLDLATKSGWALLSTDSSNLNISLKSIQADSRELLAKFAFYTKYLNSFIKSKIDLVIIEDSYFRGNARVLQFLAKIEGIAFAVCVLKNITNIRFVQANSARRQVMPNIKIKDKKDIMKWIKDNLGIKMFDDNIADAIILALCGLKMEECNANSKKD